MADRDAAILDGFLRSYQGALDDVAVQTVARADGTYALTLGLLRRLRDRLADEAPPAPSVCGFELDDGSVAYYQTGD